ncbi:hypothetical protein Glove_402g109 [Diversispora epigaea]|uniref:Uncharacterized protein n=1 Tax=Diversispora epigaea TaxID=1348612 RepID=A0A397H4I0_9GLOM|nr:hypothetical protein Glove_402g109 [Diversispora epigaea]
MFLREMDPISYYEKSSEILIILKREEIIRYITQKAIEPASLISLDSPEKTTESTSNSNGKSKKIGNTTSNNDRDCNDNDNLLVAQTTTDNDGDDHNSNFNISLVTQTKTTDNDVMIPWLLRHKMKSQPLIAIVTAKSSCLNLFRNAPGNEYLFAEDRNREKDDGEDRNADRKIDIISQLTLSSLLDCEEVCSEKCLFASLEDRNREKDDGEDRNADRKIDIISQLTLSSLLVKSLGHQTNLIIHIFLMTKSKLPRI